MIRNYFRRRSLTGAIRALEAIRAPLLLERSQLDFIDDQAHASLIALELRIDVIHNTMDALVLIRDTEAS